MRNFQNNPAHRPRQEPPEPMAGVLDVLLDLPLLPPGGWIAELGLE
jgi:hypothetical protein